MHRFASTLRRSLFGVPLHFHSDEPGVTVGLNRYFRSFPEISDGDDSDGAPISGYIERFDAARVARCVSPSAMPRGTGDRLIGLSGDGLFEEAERSWIVDDRWGLCEINLLKGQWHAWLLPTRGDAARWLAPAILWPMAQLLRPRGLHLVPSAAIARDGWTALLLTPFELDAELAALSDAGYRIIGRRWVCLSETGGPVTVSHLHSDDAPSRTSALDMLGSNSEVQATIVIDGGRRERIACSAVIEEIEPALRGAWPILELHPGRRRTARLCRMLAQQTNVFALQLSRDPNSAVSMIDLIRARPAMLPGNPPSIFEHATPALQRQAEARIARDVAA